MATLRDEGLLHALLIDWPTRRARCHCPWGWTGKWEVDVQSEQDRVDVLTALKAAHHNHIRENLVTQREMWENGEELVGHIEPDKTDTEKKG